MDVSTITILKAQSYYACVIEEMHRFELSGAEILHGECKWESNRIESDHPALKKLTPPMHGFKSSPIVRAGLRGVEAICTIKRWYTPNKQPSIPGEVRFVKGFFKMAAG